MKAIRVALTLTILALILTACGGAGIGGGSGKNGNSTPPAATAFSPGTTLTGTIQNYDGPGTTISLNRQFGRDYTNIGQISADSTFTFTLPEPIESELTRVADLENFDIFSDFDPSYANNTNARVLFMERTMRLGDGEYAVIATEPKQGATIAAPRGSLYGMFVYSDAPVRIYAPAPAMHMNNYVIDLNLVAGWNIMVEEATHGQSEDGYLMLAYRNATIDELNWYIEEPPEGFF